MPDLLRELRTIVDLTRPTSAIFRTNHASNYLPLGGVLPRDRERIVATIDAALSGKIRLRSEGARGLLVGSTIGVAPAIAGERQTQRHRELVGVLAAPIRLARAPIPEELRELARLLHPRSRPPENQRVGAAQRDGRPVSEDDRGERAAITEAADETGFNRAVHRDEGSPRAGSLAKFGAGIA